MTMLKLDMPSDEVRRQYKEKFRPLIIKRIKGELKGRKISNAARDILLPGWNSATPDTSRLDKLLVSEPKDLKDVNDDLWTQLQNLCFWNRPTKKALKDVFDYEHLIDKSKSNSFWLAQQIERNTCTYCNRTYTFTVIKGKGKNDKQRVARPTFDHWYGQSEYPLMSMSLFNLIPSCSICNSSVKIDVPFDIATHIHPYIHEAGHPNLEFKASLTTDVPPKWTVEIHTAPGSKEEKTVDDMKLNDIYAYHGELEVKDLMEFKDKYPDGYLKDLIDKVLKKSGGALTLADVYRMLFGTEIDEAKFLDRPLSKMKYDILHEMGIV